MPLCAPRKAMYVNRLISNRLDAWKPGVWPKRSPALVVKY